MRRLAPFGAGAGTGGTLTSARSAHPLSGGRDSDLARAASSAGASRRTTGSPPRPPASAASAANIGMSNGGKWRLMSCLTAARAAGPVRRICSSTRSTVRRQLVVRHDLGDQADALGFAAASMTGGGEEQILRHARCRRAPAGARAETDRRRRAAAPGRGTWRGRRRWRCRCTAPCSARRPGTGR